MRDSGIYVLITLITVTIFFLHIVRTFPGRRHKSSGRGRSTGCDFCVWFIYFGNPKMPLEPIQGQNTGSVAMELTCTFNPDRQGETRSVETK